MWIQVMGWGQNECSRSIYNKFPMDPQLKQHSLEEITSSIHSMLEAVKKSEWRKSIAKASREYNLKVYNLNKLTPLRVKELHSVIMAKFYKSNKNRDTWSENELRLFVWLCFTYAGTISTNPELFEIHHWSVLSKCFLGKKSFFCEFQFRCLKKLSGSSDRWTREEEEILERIVRNTQGEDSKIQSEDSKKLRWNEIARQFYTTSNKSHFRTGKQCRQHWNIYLDPNKLRCGWSAQEDLLLVRTVLKSGRKWSKIVQVLDNRRSQHTVKNRFNSLTVKFIKTKNLNCQKESVITQALYQWLMSLPKEEGCDVAAKMEESPGSGSGEELSLDEVPTEPFREICRIEEKQEYMVMGNSNNHSLLQKTQSPAMLISPLPMNFGSLMFSPVNIYYRNESECSFNLFSFDSLRQP